MPRSSFQRSGPTRVAVPRFLIACEGDSEENYLEAIRQNLRLSKDQIIVLNAKGTDPRTIVRAAIEERKYLRRENLWLPSDTAWAALDGDEHRDKAASELVKHVPDYKKPMSLYPGSPGALPAAIKRAARLAQRNQDNGRPFHTNPCTGLGKLVELLLQLRQ